MKKSKYLALALVLAPGVWSDEPAGAASRCYPTERFKVLDQQWVRDTLTKLVWQRQASAESMSWAEAQTYCSQAGLRLPTVKELRSIVDLTVAYPGPTIDGKAVPDTPADEFWTSSSLPGPAGRVWYVDFSYGHSYYYGDANELNYARCVR